MKRLLIFCLCLVVGLTGCRGKSYLSQNEDEPLVTSSSMPIESEENISAGYVQINGGVACPGVYEISDDTRLFNVIEMAGGLLPEADAESINQVQILKDGQSIRIPLIGESSGESKEESGKKDGKIDINTADASLLMTLPGVGESKAMQIIDYRETNGSFTSIEDIMNIRGIKEGVFNKIKDSITV